MPEIDPKAKEAMAAALKMAKTKRMFFGLVVKGTEGVLVLSKLKIPPKEIAEAKKKSGGTTVIKGACFGEKEKHVFEVAKLPTTDLTKVVKKIALRDSGLTIFPEFRLSNEPDLEEEDEGSQEEQAQEQVQATSEAPPPPPPPPPPGSDSATEFTNRFKQLKPDLDKVREAETSVSQELKTRLSEMTGLAGQKQFGPALDLLKQIETLVKRGLSDLQNKGGGSNDGGGQFATRLKALKSQIDQAIQAGGDRGNKIKLLASEAGAAARKQDFAEAERVLDRIEQALQGGGQQTSQPSTNGGPLAQRLKQVEAELLKAVKAAPDKRTALMNVWNFAQTKAKAGDAASATKALDGLEKAIRDALANAANTDAGRFGIRTGIVAERKAELEKYFADRVKAAQAKSEQQIESVEKAVSDQVPDEDANELAGAIQGEVDELYEEVREALDTSLATEDGDEVQRTIESWRKQVAGNPLVKHLAKAKAELGADANVLDDFEALFDEVAGKLRELATA